MNLGQQLPAGGVECPGCGEILYQHPQGMQSYTTLHSCPGHPTVATIRRIIREEFARAMKRGEPPSS